VPNTPGAAGRIATALADTNVSIDMIIQNEPAVAGAGADLSFTVPRADLRIALDALGTLAEDLGIDITTDESVGKVSVIGEGMKTQSGVAAQVFTTLGSEHINIQMISTSPIKISCVIELDSVQHAVRALHAAFLT
jgi:aspartate kinase